MPRRREAFERRLIGGGGRNIRSRAKIIEVHAADQLGALDQAFRRPESILEVRAAAFQFRRQSAVQNHYRTLRKEIGDGITHIVRYLTQLRSYSREYWAVDS